MMEKIKFWNPLASVRATAHHRRRGACANMNQQFNILTPTS